MKFVVIGGDAAGMSAASRAKRHMADMDVTVLEQSEDVSYSACGMPYNIAEAERDVEDLVVRKAQVFRDKQGINLLTGHRANAIDPAQKVVTGLTSSGEAFQFSYDKLLIATGGSAILPDIPGIDLPGVMALKSLDNARKIKTLLSDHPVKKAVIIGMGYIGLEMAEALRSRSIDVDMVKPGPLLLPWMPPEMSNIVRQELEDHQVGIHAGQGIEKIESQDKKLKVVCSGLTL
ncbi:MAG: FAD-dependent oxidoreductase, partial [Deltaproteobacteria bacterium]|nr:FAD-dependent oxidoreductase [Deltaproteobacteria bacterium]